MTRTPILALAAVLLVGCTHVATRDAPATAAVAATPKPVAYPSTYRPIPSPPVLLQHATVLTGTGERLDDADVLLQDGKVAAVGHALTAPQGADVVDAHGKWVTPGIIDVHSHLGVYPTPSVSALADGNEMTGPVTPNVWAEHSIWPQDPGFLTALAGGVTTLQVLPGSANLIGGRGVTLKNVPATTYQAMKFPGAPYGLKMACGENPKRVYGQKGGPQTLMGDVAGYRAAFIDAQEYAKKKDARRDLKMETLAGVLDGSIRVHIHCYRADEMATMLDLAKEFNFRIAAFHHAVEAYKIADRLAAAGVCAAMWADWWGFKMEAYDGIQENIAMVDRAPGGCAIVHSDSEEGIQRLNQEAAKVVAHARRAGMGEIPPEHAILWLTANPAKALGIDDRTGTLQPGKMGDVVVWNGTPFSSYALAEQVYIDGARVYDRHDPAHQPKSDFMLGQGGAP